MVVVVDGLVGEDDGLGPVWRLVGLEMHEYVHWMSAGCMMRLNTECNARQVNAAGRYSRRGGSGRGRSEVGVDIIIHLFRLDLHQSRLSTTTTTVLRLIMY